MHALTDVTGFGLLGHTLELARGAGLSAHLDTQALKLLPGVAALAEQGVVTGASGRNWASYGAQVLLPAGCPAATHAVLTDPQTSGGLLVACAPQALDAVLDLFKRHGFDDAAVVGRMAPGPVQVVVE